MKTTSAQMQAEIRTLLQTRPFVEVSTLHSEAIKGMEGVRITETTNILKIEKV